MKDLTLKDWANQEMNSHGKSGTFQEWLSHEVKKHGNIKIKDWGQDEIESHTERYLDSRNAEGSHMSKFQDNQHISYQRKKAETFESDTSELIKEIMKDIPNGSVIQWKEWVSDAYWSGVPQAIIEGVENMNSDEDTEVWFISSTPYYAGEDYQGRSRWGAKILWFDTKGRSQKQFYMDFMEANKGKRYHGMFHDSHNVYRGFGCKHYMQYKYGAETEESNFGSVGEGNNFGQMRAENNTGLKTIGAIAVGGALGAFALSLINGMRMFNGAKEDLKKSAEAKRSRCSTCADSGSMRKTHTQIMQSEYSVGQINPVEVEGQNDVHGAEGVINPRHEPSSSPFPYPSKSLKMW